MKSPLRAGRAKKCKRKERERRRDQRISANQSAYCLQTSGGISPSRMMMLIRWTSAGIYGHSKDADGRGRRRGDFYHPRWESWRASTPLWISIMRCSGTSIERRSRSCGLNILCTRKEIKPLWLRVCQYRFFVSWEVSFLIINERREQEERGAGRCSCGENS